MITIPENVNEDGNKCKQVNIATQATRAETVENGGSWLQNVVTPRLSSCARFSHGSMEKPNGVCDEENERNL